jgi:hypothetical protein
MTDSVRVHRPASTDASKPPPVPPTRKPDMLGWLAAGGIGGAILIMIGASFIRQDWMYPTVPVPRVGPPFELHQSIPGRPVVAALWVAALLALAGLIAGLVAVRRGGRVSIRLVLIGAALAVLALMLLPPAGSTDALDYAAYGRLAVLGHNPYVTTPVYLRITDPFFGHSVPASWQGAASVYGPAATAEQYLAARLGGTSIARIVFWLKLGNVLAFGAVAFVLDRLLRRDPAARLRAHLLWTINPLLLWDLIAAAHVDVVAAAAGFIGLLAVGRQSAGVQPRLWRAATAGALIGLAADIKIDFVLFGLALAWALRRSVPALLVAAAGALAVLIPTYAWLGSPAFHALFARRNTTSEDSFYLFAHLTNWKYLSVLAFVLFIGMAALLLRRMPAGDPLRPAIRPAIAIGLAWLVIWPYQLPWYDAMIICVLALYPASRIDWLVLLRLCAATLANMPGNPFGVSGGKLRAFDVFVVHVLTPTVLLGCAVALVWFAITGRWGISGNASEHQPVAVRLPFVTTTTFDHLAMTKTPDGMQIDGFISGETQARIAFTRRGEQLEIICTTQELACTQLAVLEVLSGWQLVSAVLEPLTYSAEPQHAEPDPP